MSHLGQNEINVKNNELYKNYPTPQGKSSMRIMSIPKGNEKWELRGYSKKYSQNIS